MKTFLFSLYVCSGYVVILFNNIHKVRKKKTITKNIKYPNDHYAPHIKAGSAYISVQLP